jgi:hypothetical protein
MMTRLLQDGNRFRFSNVRWPTRRRLSVIDCIRHPTQLFVLTWRVSPFGLPISAFGLPAPPLPSGCGIRFQPSLDVMDQREPDTARRGFCPRRFLVVAHPGMAFPWLRQPARNCASGGVIVCLTAGQWCGAPR